MHISSISTDECKNCGIQENVSYDKRRLLYKEYRMKKNSSLNKSNPLEIHPSNNFTTKTGIFFNPNTKLNDIIQDSTSQNFCLGNNKTQSRIAKSQYYDDMKKSHNQQLQYLSKKLAGLSAFFTPNKVRKNTNSTTKTNFINSSHKQGKDKVKSMIYNHKLARIMLCRHKKLIKAFGSLANYRTKDTMFANFVATNPEKTNSFQINTQNQISK